MRERSALLLRLAHEWDERGAYAAAIKCLLPVCDDAGELPTVTAAARLQLARLLLAHFDNVVHAKSALLSAVRQIREWRLCLVLPSDRHGCACSRLALPPLRATAARASPSHLCLALPIRPTSLLQEQDLRQTQGNQLLKCEVCDALALANQRLGAVQAEADALQAGLKACRAGTTSKDK